MIYLRRRIRGEPKTIRQIVSCSAWSHFFTTHYKKLSERPTNDSDPFSGSNSPIYPDYCERYHMTQDALRPSIITSKYRIRLDLLDKQSESDYLQIFYDHSGWRSIIANLVLRYCPSPRRPLSVCLLPEHPLVIISSSLLRDGRSLRAHALLDRISQGNSSAGKPFGPLYFSPEALEMLLDMAAEIEARNVLPLLTRELTRTQSSNSSSQTHRSALVARLSNVYAKLIDMNFKADRYGAVLSLYTTATRNTIPFSEIMYKRTIQSLFKHFIPSPDLDRRRFSRPRRHRNGTEPLASRLATRPPIEDVLRQVKMILDRVTADNMPLSSRILADVFRGLGAILKLETEGVEREHSSRSHDVTHNNGVEIPTPYCKDRFPKFRLDRLVLEQETWFSIGKTVANIFAQTTDPAIDPRRPGNEGDWLLRMVWGDIMVSLREDIAEALMRGTATKPEVKALSHRIDTLINADQPWNYRRTFSQFTRLSSLRSHHANSHGTVGSEVDPALDLPVGPAPGRWPISRTLVEAQRISLLIRDRLVEKDSHAALLHFHSLASLRGAFQKLCDTQGAEHASLSLAQAPQEGPFQRPAEMVLAEARQELDIRVESAYIRIAGHALRTEDPSYVNDVLELAYTLPPRSNKLTFSRIWKRAISAFVSWRSEWHGSAGIGRAFKILGNLLGIGSVPRTTQTSESGRIDRARSRRAGPSRSLFNLTWLRRQDRWPRLGRHIFPRANVVSALVSAAEEGTPPYIRLGANLDRNMGAKHLQHAHRMAQEAETRKTIRQHRECDPHHIQRPDDPSPAIAMLNVQARIDDQMFARLDCYGDPIQPNVLEKREQTTQSSDCTSRISATTILVDVLGALSVPMSTDEAERTRYPGPTYTKKVSKRQNASMR